MIQELYFTHDSISRAHNQTNTSVSLRYNTQTEELQLIDSVGRVKTISIDTDPNDIAPDDITTDYIQDKGFYTSEQIDGKIPSIDTDYGLSYTVSNDLPPVYTISLDKNTVIDIINEEITPQKIRGYFSGQSGVILTENGEIEIDSEFVEGKLNQFLDERGYVPHDYDTHYHAGEGLSLAVTPIEPTDENPNPSGKTHTFSVDQEWTSGFIGEVLDNKGIYPIQAGEGIGIEAEDGINTISLTAHIPSGLRDVWTDSKNIKDISGLGFIQIGDVPVYTAGEGIEVDENKVISLTAQIPRYTAGKLISISDDYEVSFTGSIPTGLNNWKIADNKKYISDIGFAQTSAIPTKISDLEDDSEFITSGEVDTKLSDYTKTNELKDAISSLIANDAEFKAWLINVLSE